MFSLGEGYGCTFTVDIPITVRTGPIIIDNNTYEIGCPHDVLTTDNNQALFSYNLNDDYNSKLSYF